MAIIRNPNQSYERKLGALKLYLDDVEDLVRYLSQKCSRIKLEIGDNGEAETLDDLKGVEAKELRTFRITANRRSSRFRRLQPKDTSPDILLSLGFSECRALATKGDDESKEIIDNLARLLEPRKRTNPTIVVIVSYGVGLIFMILAFWLERFLLLPVALCGWLFGIFVLFRGITRPVLVPDRRREVRSLSRERRSQIVLAVVSGAIGLLGGVVIAWISNFLPGER